MTVDRKRVRGPTVLAWFGYGLGALFALNLLAPILLWGKPELLGDPNNIAFLVFGLLFGFVVMPYIARHLYVEVTPEHIEHAYMIPRGRIPWSQVRRVELSFSLGGYGLDVFMIGPREYQGVAVMSGSKKEVAELWDLIRRYAPDAVSNVEGFPSGPLR